MKLKFLSLTALLTLTFSAMSAVYTVSNVPNSVANYTTIAAAITAASTGDTIYVQPSNTNYGSITLSKSLVLIGAGTWPEGQTGARSMVTSFTLNNANASGSTIKGFDITQNLPGITVNATVVNLTFEYNRLIAISLSGSNINNVVIRNNVFYTNVNGVIYGSSVCTNILISNNIFRTTTTTGNILALSNSANNGNLFANNIIKHDAATVNPLRGASNFTIVDNIIYGGSSTVASDAIQNCNIFHNLFYGNYTQAGVFHASSNGANNLFGTTFDPVFTEIGAINNMWGYAPTAPFTSLELPANSPAIGSGSNGADMGIYDGSFPWMDNPAGASKRYYPGARIPEIYELVSPGVAAPNSTMQVQIKARNAN